MGLSELRGGRSSRPNPFTARDKLVGVRECPTQAAGKCPPGLAVMVNTMSDDFWARPWYRIAVLIVLAPLMLIVNVVVVLPVLACMLLYALVYNWISRYGLRSRMRRCGRYLSLAESQLRIAQDGGTLILESPSLHWDYRRAWWTPDEVRSRSPFTVQTEEDRRQAIEQSKVLDWDRWCYDNYTSPDNGRAFLLRVGNGAALERSLKRQFPDLSVVRAWTGPVYASRSCGNPVFNHTGDKVDAE